jgi:hypothetical protein
MATSRSVGDPLGKDNKPGSDAQVDAKDYVMYMVKSTKHWFYAPKNKYKDIAGALGLEEVDPDSGKGENAIKLANGQGYIRLMAKLKSGATLSLVCDPQKVGEAMGVEGGGGGIGGGADGSGTAEGKKIYGEGVRRIYIPKKRILL